MQERRDDHACCERASDIAALQASANRQGFRELQENKHYPHSNHYTLN